MDRGVRRRLACIGLVMVVMTTAPARADKKRDAEAAREHTQRATVAYNLGHFDEAVEEFEAAYKLVLDPALLFNVAQAHRLGGRPERALATYKAYLRTAPRGAGDRKQAEKWRDELERSIAAAPASAERVTERAPIEPAAPARAEADAPTRAEAAAPAPQERAPDAPEPAANASTGKPAPAANASTAKPAVADDDERASAGDAAPLPRAPILEIDIGPRVLWRAFAYTSSAPPMAGYLLDFTPVLGGKLSLFPAAHTAGVFRYLGLLASVEAATWMRSEGFATGTSDVVAGAQARVLTTFGQLGGSVSFFRHAFVLRDTPDPTDQPRVELTFPNTSYVGVRFGLGGRVNLGRRVVLALEGGYRLVASPGEGVGLVRSTDYFPTGYVSYGVDGGASLGVRLFSWCLARVGIDHRRYVFGPLRGETRTAAGATDAYMAVSLSVVGEIGAHSQLRSGR